MLQQVGAIAQLAPNLSTTIKEKNMSQTVRELIGFLSKMPEETVIAMNQMWLKEDAEEFTDSALTDEQWEKVAYYYSNNERFGGYGLDILEDAVREVTND